MKTGECTFCNFGSLENFLIILRGGGITHSCVKVWQSACTTLVDVRCYFCFRLFLCFFGVSATVERKEFVCPLGEIC
jgi:hypothetical protein